MAGVMVVNYIDDKKSTTGKGLPINIFFDVSDYYFLRDQVGFLKIELANNARKCVYIPTSNIGLVEYFETEEDFREIYPRPYD